MRQAAGIMLTIFGVFLLNTVSSALSGYPLDAYDIVLAVFTVVSAAFLVIGGISCLMRKRRRVCLASAWLAVFSMIMWLTGSPVRGLDWLSWVFSVLGTLSIVFLYLTKEEWKPIQD